MFNHGHKRYLSIIGLFLFISGCSNLPLNTGLSVMDTEPETEFLLYEPEDNLTEEELAALPAPIDIWSRIRSGYQLPQPQNKRVQQQLNWYAKHPEYIKRVTQRGERYLYHIVEQVEARGLPMELALLPIVESAFDPFAYSHGRASGIWQFIPGTGKMMGLKQNWWYDGRRDVVASTDAALRYLESLNQRFNGDWMHALASYNSGSGNVSRAIRKNKRRGKPTDFWNLDLPRETEAYVPKLIALAMLVENPESHNVHLYPIANEPFFAEVDVEAQIDLAQAAEMAGVDMDTLYQLNPGFNHWATDPKGPHRLLVPVKSALQFQQELATIPADQRVTWERYTIRNGDSLSTIARKYKISTDTLKSINKLRNNFIRAGHTLMVPIATANIAHYSKSTDQRLKQRQQASAKAAKGKRIDHLVASGESLWSISQRYNVSTRKIARWNNMAPADPIYPGQKLAIFSSTGSLQASSKLSRSPVSQQNAVIRKVSYKVRNGDSLHRIASRFKLRVNDILRWNKLNASKYLQPGQSLTLFVDVTRVN